MCPRCTCRLHGCCAPRRQGPLRSAHKRMWDALPAAVRAIHADRAGALGHMPVDVVDFLAHWPADRHDLPLSVALAVREEPTATEAMRTAVSAATRDEGSAGTASAAALAAGFRAVAEAVNGAPTSSS